MKRSIKVIKKFVTNGFNANFTRKLTTQGTATLTFLYNNEKFALLFHIAEENNSIPFDRILGNDLLANQQCL